MAEQEVIKHTKKIFSLWGNKENSFWHKLKEFLLEIFIIVFAISLSIWFHNRSEHSHQQEDIKQFLIGMKSDLINDLVEIQNDKKSYFYQKAAFSYITNIKLNHEPDIDSLNKYDNWLFNTTALEPNDGRFEGFRSSGKIGLIENRELQNDIMDLYQEQIVSLLAATNQYISVKRKLFDYININKKRLTDSTNNLSAILSKDEAQNICTVLSSPKEVLDRYDQCISKMNKIIAEIDEEYNLKE